MARDERRKRIYRDESIDAPQSREEKDACDHKADHKDAKQERESKLFQELRHLLEKGCVFDFFGRSTPGHIDLEHV